MAAPEEAIEEVVEETEHGPKTTISCGACGRQHYFRGLPRDYKGTVFTCGDCGHLNIVPSPPWGKLNHPF